MFAAAIQDKTARNVRSVARDASPPPLSADETFLVFRVVPGRAYDS